MIVDLYAICLLLSCQAPSHKKRSVTEPESFEGKEEEYLTKLRRKSKKKLFNKQKRKVSRASLVLPEVGSRLYHQKELLFLMETLVHLVLK